MAGIFIGWQLIIRGLPLLATHRFNFANKKQYRAYSTKNCSKSELMLLPSPIFGKSWQKIHFILVSNFGKAICAAKFGNTKLATSAINPLHPLIYKFWCNGRRRIVCHQNRFKPMEQYCQKMTKYHSSMPRWPKQLEMLLIQHFHQTWTLRQNQSFKFEDEE